MTAFFEDMVVGECIELGSYQFTKDNIIAFARDYDKQSPVLNGPQADAPIMASNWHVAGVWMRLMIERQKLSVAERMHAGEPVAKLGPSPGYKNQQWACPVYAQDEIRYFTTVSELRDVRSRPEWGLLGMFNEARNAQDEQVYCFDGIVFLERRTPYSGD